MAFKFRTVAPPNLIQIVEPGRFWARRLNPVTSAQEDRRLRRSDY